MKERGFIKAMNSVKITSEAEDNILNKVINSNNKKENVKMLKKRFAVIAAAAVLAVSITAVAANGVITKWYSSSSSTSEYTSLPSYEQCEKDVGFAPVLIDSFDNGYKFKEGSIVNNDLRDDSDNNVEKFKSFTFRYEKDAETVLLSAEKIDFDTEMEGDVISASDGTDLHYISYTNKCVPADYKLTEEDKQAEENGDLIFSYGTNDITVSVVQGLTWNQDGIRYNLLQIDGHITKDELVNMANEIIAE